MAFADVFTIVLQVFAGIAIYLVLSIVTKSKSFYLLLKEAGKKLARK